MKIGLFVDISTLYYCTSKKFDGRKIDYEKFLTWVSGMGDIFRAIAYTTQYNVGFSNALNHLGFEIKHRPSKDIKVGEKTIQVAQWETGITCDVVRMMSRIDLVILATSNPNLTDLIQLIKEKGLQCFVVGVGVPRELRDSATRVIELDESILTEGGS